MEQDGKKEVSRREFLAWAAAIAAMVVLPGSGAHAAAEPAGLDFMRASAAVSANNYVPVAATGYDPFGPIVVPDPPPSVVINGGVIERGGGQSASYQTTTASYRTTTSYASPGYAQPAPASYQTASYQTAGYQQPTVAQPVSYQQPATLSASAATASYAAPSAYAAPVYNAPPVYQPPQPPPARQPQQQQGNKLHAVSRASWSSTAANPQKMRPMNKVDRITIHHEGSAKPNTDTTPNEVAATLRLIQIQHRKRMGAGDIGYHFVIDRTGRIWQGRDWSYQGAHTANNNSNNLGVMLLGNFDIQSPTQAQLQSLHALVRSLARMHGVSRNRIFGHSDFCNTQCPGKHLKPQVQYLRNNL